MAELVAYLHLAGEAFTAAPDEEVENAVVWQSGDGRRTQARLPRVIFQS
ncbi:MAG TPA: DUF3375 family protein [Methylococcaceae bacterium]|nr:DUF3375 family protein [Methylococcaceae bacterium]